MRQIKVTTAFAFAALFGVITTAQAQNASTARTAPSPASINAGDRPTTPSGAESQATATGAPRHVMGSKKYCSVLSGQDSLNCVFASLDSCKKHNKSSALHCVTNPNL